jgi:hypothetical protein
MWDKYIHKILGKLTDVQRGMSLLNGCHEPVATKRVAQKLHPERVRVSPSPLPLRTISRRPCFPIESFQRRIGCLTEYKHLDIYRVKLVLSM